MKAKDEGQQARPDHAYSVKALRDREMDIARHAEQAYEQFIA